MGYRNLQQCVRDLERAQQLVRVLEPVDPHLQAAVIHRRVYQAGGPALLFENPTQGKFPLLSNLFGTLSRTEFLYRDALPGVQALVDAKIDPSRVLRHPKRWLGALRAGLHTLPRFVSPRRAPVLRHSIPLNQLPPLQCWPDDGGPFITLPCVYTENPDQPGWKKSNLGMYRVQLAGNAYDPACEVGLHYQIHRGIGIHHGLAGRRDERLPVVIWVGGPPVLPMSAVMPLPEHLPELAFAGALGGRRLELVRPPGFPLPIPAQADFCLIGSIDPTQTKPEGPFGDHLGYYSLVHDFPVMRVEKVYHRPDAIWPFTVVGRPPQEDTSFGEFIHHLTGPVIPSEVPGVHAVHAVDAAGVHPLLLAVGSERYTPYQTLPRPQELLTCANAILGKGQLSLAKYLLIVARQDDPSLDINDIPAFFQHLLGRVDWTTDLHFQTRTTIDTLDYTGTGLNQGSKVVIAAVGPPRRSLPSQLPDHDAFTLPDGFRNPRVCFPGILALTSPAFSPDHDPLAGLTATLTPDHPLADFPLWILVDDSDFVAQTLENFLWATFTRSDPARDLHGIAPFTEHKHWGCHGPLIIDARLKPHHAPPLLDDPNVLKSIEPLFAPGGSLHAWA